MSIRNHIDTEKGFWSEEGEELVEVTSLSGSVSFENANIHEFGFADLPLLKFLVDEGPFEAYGNDLYHEITYEAKVFPKTRTWYRDSFKTKKIVEQRINRNPNKTPKEIIWRVYNKNGMVKKTSVDTITYASNGILEVSRRREIFDP